MTSAVDVTKPVDGVAANKADIRANWITIKAEIEALQLAIGSVNSENFQGLKNKLINPYGIIDQRNANAVVTPAATAYVVDRWKFTITQASKLSAQGVAAALTTPRKTVPGYLSVKVVTPFTPGAADQFTLDQPMTGQNTCDLTGKSVTLSFDAYASIPGLYGVCLKVGTRYCMQTFQILVANTVESKTVTFPVDASPAGGVVTVAENTRLLFDLGCGSNFEGTAGVWGNSAVYRTSSCVKHVSQAAASDLRITAIQLERGASASTFEERPMSVEWQLCYHYFFKMPFALTFAGNAAGAGIGQLIYYSLPVPMRASPTFTQTYSGGTNVGTASSALSTTWIEMYMLSVGAGLTAFTVDATNTFTAEL